MTLREAAMAGIAVNGEQLCRRGTCPRIRRPRSRTPSSPLRGVASPRCRSWPILLS